VAGFPSFRPADPPGPPRPLKASDGATSWLITRFDDAVAALTHPKLSRAGGYGHQADPASPREPDVPAPLRELVSNAFSARRVAALRPRIRQLADELLDGVPGRGPHDLIEMYAYPLAARVIAEVLGIPWPVRQRLRQAPAAGIRTGPDPAILRKHLGQLVAARRRYPGTDLISRLIAAQVDGEPSGDEVLKTVCALYVAGHLATARLIGTSVLVLLRNPGLLAAIREEPERLAAVVDELLRYAGPVNPVVRQATAALDIGDVAIPAGSRVVIAVRSANHDPSRFTAPDSVNLRNGGATGHLAFGGGLHHCVGAQLAKAEAEVALSRLFERYPDLNLAVPPGGVAPERPDPADDVERLPVRIRRGGPLCRNLPA
jgi:cytochrome P450